MSRRFAPFIGCAGSMAVAVLLTASLAGQSPAAKGSASAVAKATTGAKAWTPPRAADGHADLTGVWANNVATPLERPKVLEGRAQLTAQEVAALQARAAKLFNGDSDAAFGDSVFEAALNDAKGFVSRDGKTGDYNHFWLVERDFDNRTSLITNPPDGKMPPLTPAAQARRAASAAARVRRAEGPEDRSLGERCISFGVPRVNAGYNSYIQLFQSADSVAIQMETIHDARLVPLDGKPHVANNVRLWHGDSRGRWEGDTLVIDTTNYSSKGAVMGATDKLHVIERFTRVSPKTLHYEITFDDPDTWTKPWTLMIPLKYTTDAIYEYACHEGNSGLEGILAGARAEERAEAPAKRAGTQER